MHNILQANNLGKQLVVGIDLEELNSHAGDSKENFENLEKLYKSKKGIEQMLREYLDFGDLSV